MEVKFQLKNKYSIKGSLISKAAYLFKFELWFHCKMANRLIILVIHLFRQSIVGYLQDKRKIKYFQFRTMKVLIIEFIFVVGNGHS